MDEAALRRSLLRWYRRHARDLPWRRPPLAGDPYAVWVSEVMLQQTRIDVATPYYLRWMARFPTAATLAAADEEDVLRLWAGLGYYSRARKLHAAAQQVAREGMPANAAALRRLPGVGPYTAGAIASIAFGERVPAVDGNVVRVLARLHGWPGAASSIPLLRKVGKSAARLVPPTAPGDWNQALMDLGATVCTPRSPRCGACPVARHCQAKATGRQASIPAPKRQARPRVERRAFAVVRRGDRILLVRNPATGLLAGLWSLPGGAADRPLADHVLDQAGTRVRMRGNPAAARHQFSHRTWEMAVDVADLLQERAAEPQREVAWVPERDLAAHALPAAMHAALAAVAGPTRHVTPARATARTAAGKPKRRQDSGRA